jgi:chemotaxis protein methyltransferase CheR
MNLSQNEYSKIKDLIYSNTGIFLGDSKIGILSRRVDSRMEKLDLKTARDYYRYLVLDGNRGEIEELINLVVVPETYFFRDYPQLKLFAEAVLPTVTAEKSKNRNLSLLSAGCSTGDEPYTLAIILREMLDNVDEWNIRIDAVDINGNVLQKALDGVYTSRSLRETPYLYRNMYFTKEDDSYIISPHIREMVTFRRVNLFNKAQMSVLFRYDVVFCRNVLIYFDHASAGKVMESLYEMMNPGAFIFLGSAESVGRLTSLFKLVRFGNSFVYRK